MSPSTAHRASAARVLQICLLLSSSGAGPGGFPSRCLWAPAAAELQRGSLCAALGQARRWTRCAPLAGLPASPLTLKQEQSAKRCCDAEDPHPPGAAGPGAGRCLRVGGRGGYCPGRSGGGCRTFGGPRCCGRGDRRRRKEPQVPPAAPASPARGSRLRSLLLSPALSSGALRPRSWRLRLRELLAKRASKKSSLFSSPPTPGTT